ncbi:hypothetical protein CH286_02105 [Rhodococcus sp. WWJCD1]|nr:hypothetical protein CH286_02105 [Rhodococcus sp. WWJCD1]
MMSLVPPTTREIVEEFVRLFYYEKDVPSAFDRFVAEDYIQHNPAIADGRPAAIDHLKHVFTADAHFEVQRMVVEEDLAVVHVRATVPGRPILAVADIYRLENGSIVEHWDVVQALPETATNPHPLF